MVEFRSYIEMESCSYPNAIFTSMGMFIIDEIQYPIGSNKPPQYNIIGGGGTYGAIGGRIVAGKDNSERIGWIVDKGADFPIEVENEINGWKTGVIIRTDNSRLTTRGLNTYGANDFREFVYQTPKKRLEVSDIIQYPSLLNAESFHLICSPERCIEILGQLETKRTASPPVIIWEPLPDDCTPEKLDQCLSILDRIDILSPNAAEAAAFFALEEPTDPQQLEELASRFVPKLVKDTLGSKAGIVLRCGPQGCYMKTSDDKVNKWLPAYHNVKNPDFRVIDPTGGGNTFVGAFGTAFSLSNGDWLTSGICGNIASGIAIETIGMPVLTDDGAEDIWNGKSFTDRVGLYLERNANVGVSTTEVLSHCGRH